TQPDGPWRELDHLAGEIAVAPRMPSSLSAAPPRGSSLPRNRGDAARRRAPCKNGGPFPRSGRRQASRGARTRSGTSSPPAARLRRVARTASPSLARGGTCACPSFDHLIRPEQPRMRDLAAERLCCLAVASRLTLSWLSHRVC